MTQNTLQKSHLTVRQAEVAFLRPLPEFEVRSEPFKSLIKDGGVSHAEDAIFSSLETIALNIEQACQDRRGGQFGALFSITTDIKAVSERMGFVTVLTSSQQLQLALETGNIVAIDATLARLERAFEALVTKIWDYFDDI